MQGCIFDCNYSHIFTFNTDSHKLLCHSCVLERVRKICLKTRHSFQTLGTILPKVLRSVKRVQKRIMAGFKSQKQTIMKSKHIFLPSLQKVTNYTFSIKTPNLNFYSKDDNQIMQNIERIYLQSLQLLNQAYHNLVQSEEQKLAQNHMKQKASKINYRNNFASQFGGAFIISKNHGLLNAKSILIDDHDRYMLNQCRDPNQFIIIGLKQDISILEISIVNKQYYSSNLKEFQVFGTHEYVDQNEFVWNSLGNFTCNNTSDQQFFKVKESWVRYLKFRFISHYDNEFYCTITQIKVFGQTLLSQFQNDFYGSIQQKKGFDVNQTEFHDLRIKEFKFFQTDDQKTWVPEVYESEPQIPPTYNLQNLNPYQAFSVADYFSEENFQSYYPPDSKNWATTVTTTPPIIENIENLPVQYIQKIGVSYEVYFLQYYLKRQCFYDIKKQMNENQQGKNLKNINQKHDLNRNQSIYQTLTKRILEDEKNIDILYVNQNNLHSEILANQENFQAKFDFVQNQTKKYNDSFHESKTKLAQYEYEILELQQRLNHTETEMKNLVNDFHQRDLILYIILAFLTIIYLTFQFVLYEDQ